MHLETSAFRVRENFPIDKMKDQSKINFSKIFAVQLEEKLFLPPPNFCDTLSFILPFH